MLIAAIALACSRMDRAHAERHSECGCVRSRDRQTAAELLGVNVKGLQLGVWVIAGGLWASVISIVGNTGAADATSMIVLVIPAPRPRSSAHSRVSPWRSSAGCSSAHCRVR